MPQGLRPCSLLTPPRAHTNLREASVSEATVATYVEGLDRFKLFIAAWGVRGSFSELLEAPEAFESTLVFFVQWLYDNGHPRSHATALLSALVFFHPRLASTAQLARSHRQLKGWVKLFPTKHKIPMPKSISRLFATRFAQMGRLDCAICLLTGFDNYLRPGESVGSRVEDIVYPTAAARSEAFRHGIWTLPRTKTGDNQSVTMRHDAGAILLPMLTEGKPKRAYLFPDLEGQYHRWYHLLAQVAAYFGLQNFKWTPHTPRLGGSTEDFLRLHPILDILRRGRWASVKSLTSYVQQLRAVSPCAEPVAPGTGAHTRPAYGHVGRDVCALPPVLPAPSSTSTLRVVGPPFGSASAPSSRPLIRRRSGSGAAASPLTPRIVTFVLLDFVLRCGMEVVRR